MASFVTRAEPTPDGRVAFDAAETRHLGRVLRLGPGDLVTAVDGRGRRWQVRLTELTPRAAAGVIVGDDGAGRESPLHLTLVQGVPKADKMDLVVRVATELGATRVVPVLSHRTVVRAPAGGWSERVVRWQRIAAEATKQCGRARIPDVASPVALEAWLRAGPERGLLVCFWERATGAFGDVLPPPPVDRATLVVGPEGGLADAEVEALRAAGAAVTGVGPRILRTETAGPVGLALLQARYGDLASGA